jgi:hypothetical protein
MYPGMRTYDEMKRLVDSVARTSSTTGATTASSTPALKK